MTAGTIPPCARPIVDLGQDYVDEVLSSLQKIRDSLGEYGVSRSQMQELSALARSAVTEPKPFPWNPTQVAQFLSRPRDGPVVQYPTNSAYRSLPFQVLVGKFYIVNPATEQDDGDDDK